MSELVEITSRYNSDDLYEQLFDGEVVCDVEPLEGAAARCLFLVQSV